MTKEKSFIFYTDFKFILNFLSQEEKGDLIDLLVKYTETLECPDIENDNVSNAFEYIKNRMDDVFSNREISRENGKKGGRPPKKKTPTKTKNNPEKPTQTLNGNGNGNGNVNDKEKKNGLPFLSKKFLEILNITIPPNLSRLMAWIEKWDIEFDIIPTLQHVADRCRQDGKDPPHSPNYYEPIIAQAYANRTKPLPEKENDGSGDGVNIQEVIRLSREKRGIT